MKYKPLRVLLGAFDKDDKLIDFFELIEDADLLDQEELEHQMIKSFNLFIQYGYNPKYENEELFCKCMFIYSEDYWSSYIYDDKNQIYPTDLKFMSFFYKQDVNGQTMKIYE